MEPDEPKAQWRTPHLGVIPQQGVDQIPVVIRSVDRTVRIRCAYRAACRLYGYTAPPEILVRRLDEVIGPATFTQYQSTIEAALRGETRVYDADWVADGAERANEVHLTPRLGPTGEVVGCDYLSIDITARRRAEVAQRKWTQALLLRQEEQRRAVAHQLHEGISQALTGLNLWLATAGGPDPHVAGGPAAGDGADRAGTQACRRSPASRARRL
jgi:PAS domain S-box-containing protein